MTEWNDDVGKRAVEEARQARIGREMREYTLRCAYCGTYYRAKPIGLEPMPHTEEECWEVIDEQIATAERNLAEVMAREARARDWYGDSHNRWQADKE
jgi:hypothetical protein